MTIATSSIIIILLTFAFGYLNGLHGAGTVIATVVSSRALRPNMAILLAVLCMSIGPFVFGIAVAGTIGVGLINVQAVTIPVVIAALAGAIGYMSIAAWLKLPSSATQAFIGSIVGAATAGFGTQAIVADGLIKALLALLLSPLLGILAGYLVVKVSYRATKTATPEVNRWFKNGQVAISVLVATAFGSNDGQKVMGILALGILATQTTDSQFTIPYWAAAFAALAMAVGTVMGSKRVIKTLGARLYRVQPIHGFGAQTASGLVLLSASLLGSPVSGSQVIASAIVGAGSAERVRMVRWGMFRQILGTWVLTMPASALAGAGICLILTSLMR
jgi:PiT family inorganic phosphate transporter